MTIYSIYICHQSSFCTWFWLADSNNLQRISFITSL